MQAFMLCGRQITYQIFQCITTASVTPGQLLLHGEIQQALTETSTYTARITFAPVFLLDDKSLWKSMQTEYANI